MIALCLIVGRNVLCELKKALRDKIMLPAVRSAKIVDDPAGEATQIVDKAAPACVNVDATDALELGEAPASHADLVVAGDAELLRLAAIEHPA